MNIMSDKNQFPSEDVIYSHLGKSKKLWQSLFDYIHDHHPDFSETWRYYNDGKSWLLKVSRKTKTIFWLSTVKNSFRTTFYFTEKAKEAIMSSAISDDLKKQFRYGKKYGKIRGITVTYKSKKDITYAKLLIEIKNSIK